MKKDIELNEFTYVIFLKVSKEIWDGDLILFKDDSQRKNCMLAATAICPLIHCVFLIHSILYMSCIYVMCILINVFHCTHIIQISFDALHLMLFKMYIWNNIFYAMPSSLCISCHVFQHACSMHACWKAWKEMHSLEGIE